MAQVKASKKPRAKKARAKKKKKKKKKRSARAKAPAALAPSVCPLTALPQGQAARAAWHDALEAALARGVPAVLALIDVDEFARHNEAVGRERGDALLVEVASRVAQVLGEGATFCRLAGDQFGVVLADVELEEALPVLERARAAVARSALRVGRGARKRQVELTVSAGLASLRRDGGELRALLEQANAALWRAKSLGGSRVGLADRQRMVLKTSYYPSDQLAKLKRLANTTGLKESVLLREALEDLFLKHKGRVDKG